MRKEVLVDASYTQNRELSWLKFNERVLAEANDRAVPLYERLKFLAIFTSNLDEFFMVRVGSLYDLSQLKKEKFDNKSFLTPSEQLGKIFLAVEKLYKKRDEIFARVDKALKAQAIQRANIKKIAAEEAAFLEQYFDTQIAPILSPQIIDLQHPFPHLVNKGLYIAVLLKCKKKMTLGIIPVPPVLPKLVYLPGNTLRYVLLEKIIFTYAYKIFDQYSLVDSAVICTTRNADISPDDEAPEVGEDYLHHMKKTLKKRLRLAPVRLEIETSGDSLMIDYLQKRLQIKREQVYITKAPINLSYVFSLADRFNKKQRELQYKPFLPVALCEVSPWPRMIDYVLRQDVLLNYPYQSFDLFLHLIKEAVYDKKVVSIKIALYRIGKSAKLMTYLSTAAEMGKDVMVFMELRARFDEANNINWAEYLREAGCKIIYGAEGYKVHAKICLITRRENECIQYITQIGTGNYNAQTAGVYTDLSLLTGNGAIGKDAAAFFNNMGVANLAGQYEQLLVAPTGFKMQLFQLIETEAEKARAGEPCGILLKMNSLTDRQLIDRLALASQAGVRIHLIVRGICCLLPGIPDKTENIEVISIVGRFLEHSRIFCFGDKANLKIYISSADWMTRNTENRVEIACPILDADIRQGIYDALLVLLADNVKGRCLNPDGDYEKRNTGARKTDAQAYFMRQYTNVAKMRQEVAGAEKLDF